MFGEKERPLRVVDQNPTTLLDRGCHFEGKLTFEGSVQINGKFRGEIFSEGTLVIGEGADVAGKIDIDTVVISGQVNGSLHAKRKIEMLPPAIVRADIVTSSLVVEEGAVFEGNCSMGKQEAQSQEPAASVLDFGS